MPAKPCWYSKIDEVIRELRAFPRTFVDRATLEALLGVGRRRAQQILAPCVTDRVGSNGLADRDALIARLLRLAQGEDAFYEIRRRQKLARVLEQLRQQRMDHPQLLVEAPRRMANQELASLPEGIHVEAGRITVEFEEARQALEKLLALALAVSNDFAEFERKVHRPVRSALSRKAADSPPKEPQNRIPANHIET